MRFILAAVVVLSPLQANNNEAAKRLDDAATVFSEIMATPDKGIPEDLIENARCIVIVPELKTGLSYLAQSMGKVTCPAVTKAARAGRPRTQSASRAEASAFRSAVLPRT